MRFLLTLLPITLVAIACTTGVDKPSNNKTPVKMMVGMYGFFNSENAEKFSPKTIDYVAVSLPQAHSAIIDHMQTLDSSNALQVLSWQETDEIIKHKNPEQPRDLVRTRLLEILSVLDETVQTRQVPDDQAWKLKAPLRLPQNWDANDRVLVVIGLESVRRPTPRGITSVLGCVWFSGKGAYLGLTVTPYNFTQFDTAKLADTVTGKCF